MAATSDTSFQTILDTVLADVNAIVPNFTSVVSAYRLLVGSVEEIQRIPGVSPDVLARAIDRFDRTGVVIDILIDLLCCKISFSSDLLSVTCAPVDLFRMLATRLDVQDTPHKIAEEIILLEVLRRAEECLRRSDGPCAPPCAPPGPPAYTFATSFYKPPLPPPMNVPAPIPPDECFPDTTPNPPPQQAAPSGENGAAPASTASTMTTTATAPPPPPNAAPRPRRLRR